MDMITWRDLPKTKEQGIKTSLSRALEQAAPEVHIGESTTSSQRQISRNEMKIFGSYHQTPNRHAGCSDHRDKQETSRWPER